MRTRTYKHMNAEERETFSLGPACGHSLRTMEMVLRRASSTVSREHARNAVQGPYRGCTAHILASARARQPRRPHILLDPWLCQSVRIHLAQGGPEQIAGRLQRAYPDDMGKQLSTETIYAGLCMCCPAARCGANCWSRCVRRARRSGLGREGPIDAVRSST